MHGLIDWIGISNQGGIEEGLILSEEIAQELRIALVDKSIARQIAEIIKNGPALNKIVEHLDDLEVSGSTRGNSLNDETVQSLRDIINEIEDGRHDSEKYLGLIAKEDNIRAIITINRLYLVSENNIPSPVSGVGMGAKGKESFSVTSLIFSICTSGIFSWAKFFMRLFPDRPTSSYGCTTPLGISFALIAGPILAAPPPILTNALNELPSL